MTGPATARDLWRLVEPLHAVTYFSPEPIAAMKAAGYRGYWMGYFAGRSAPLGAAPAELVQATFYNFDTAHVARALPDAWSFASPEAALAARLEGAGAALRRLLADVAPERDVRAATDLALRAASVAPVGARPLFAANLALPVPEDPYGGLWHAMTLLREHRGDGHVVALAAAGVGGRAAHVLHALASGTPATVYETARNLDPDEWAAELTALVDRGWAAKDATLTDAGRQAKDGIEQLTDELAWTAYAGLPGGAVADLARLLQPLATAVVASGEIPAQSPMGLRLDRA